MRKIEFQRVNQHRRRFGLRAYETMAQCIADDGLAKMAAFKKIKSELEDLADFNFERAQRGQKLATCINDMKDLQRGEKKAT